jgi:hypothetical protein
MRPRSLPPTSVLASTKKHGMRIKYVAGCRCLPCRAAYSRYQRQQAHKKKQGLGNPLVPTAAARAHLIKLSQHHVGRATVAVATGIAQSSLSKIRNGSKTQIRKDTERRILQISPTYAKGNALVDAAPTWKLINTLLKEGFSKALLARRLGYKTGALPINKSRIRARTAVKIRQFFDMIMAI